MRERRRRGEQQRREDQFHVIKLRIIRSRVSVERGGLVADQQFDVVIIGSGPGGYVAGIRAGQLGMKVAVIEKDPFLGGTCTHRGCIPTKALLENADIFEHVNRAKEFGINISGVQLDFKTGQDRKQQVVDKNAKGIEFLFKKNKVERITGFGKLINPTTVDVDGKQITAKNIID